MTCPHCGSKLVYWLSETKDENWVVTRTYKCYDCEKTWSKQGQAELLIETKTDHKERHIELHKALDELLADYMVHTGKLLGETTVSELIDWSYKQAQAIEPTEVEKE